MSLFFDRWAVAVRSGKIGDIIETDRQWGRIVSSGTCAFLDQAEIGRLRAMIDRRTIHVLNGRSVDEWLDYLDDAPNFWENLIVCSPPPFRTCWVEYSGDSRAFEPEIRKLLSRRSFGILCESDWHSGSGGGVGGSVFMEPAPGLPVYFLGQIGTVIDGNARPNVIEFAGVLGDTEGVKEKQILQNIEQIKADMIWAARLAMLTFQLMSCEPENVPRAIVEPAKGLSRNWRRKYGHDLVKYYALDVGPDASERRKAQHLHDEAKREGRPPPRLHWVRGHFKRGQYVTPERPQGRYCRPFLRGSSESGIVVKDYNVRAPHTPPSPQPAA